MTAAISRARYLQYIESELDAFLAAARSVRPDTTVRSYPRYTVGTLAGHVAEILNGVTANIETGVFSVPAADESAAGEHRPIAVELAVDAINDLFGTWMPLGFADLSEITEPGTVAVSAVDAGERWTVQFDGASVRGGPTAAATDAPDTDVSGPAADVMLMLWKRLPVHHSTFTITGDGRCLDRLLCLDYVPDPKHG